LGAGGRLVHYLSILEVEVMKLLSGRLWLTIIAGVVFGYCSIRGTLDSQAVSAIVTAVFMSYFSRDRKDENGKPH
jgi:hypothetical protein